MPSLAYVTLTGDFVDGSGNPATGTVTLQASQTGYASGVPVVSGDSPIVAQIVAGQLLAQGGGPLRVLPTDTADLTLDGPTGWWAWTASPVINGVAEVPWSFFLPSTPSSVPLWSTRGTGTPGGGVVNSVTAGDASVVIGGTQADPTVETGRPDQIFTAHPPTAALGMNGQKLTGLANGAASSDSAAFGQIPTTAASIGGVTKAGDTMGGHLAPKVAALSQAAGAVAVDASTGNVFTLTLTASGWTISNPTSPVDGQVIRFRLTQDATGSRTVSWGTAYNFGTAGTPTLTTTAAKTDAIGFEYSAALSAWCCLGSAGGF